MQTRLPKLLRKKDKSKSVWNKGMSIENTEPCLNIPYCQFDLVPWTLSKQTDDKNGWWTGKVLCCLLFAIQQTLLKFWKGSFRWVHHRMIFPSTARKQAYLIEPCEQRSHLSHAQGGNKAGEGGWESSKASSESSRQAESQERDRWKVFECVFCSLHCVLSSRHWLHYGIKSQVPASSLGVELMKLNVIWNSRLLTSESSSHYGLICTD